MLEEDLVDDLWLCCAQENDLVPYRSREDIVYVLKLAIVWNLIQIDADDSLLVVLRVRLRAHLTEASSSMIDSSSSISLSVDKLDLVLVYTRRALTCLSTTSTCRR
jgi:hypothetical protein